MNTNQYAEDGQFVPASGQEPPVVSNDRSNADVLSEDAGIEEPPTPALSPQDEEKACRDKCRRMLASVGSPFPTIIRGEIATNPVQVKFGALILSPIQRMAEKEGFFYKDGNYHGRNLIEPGATEDGFTIFPEGNAYDRKLGKKYSRREMGDLAVLRGFGYNDSVHDRGTVRCNPAPLSAGSSAGGPAFDWERSKQWIYKDENGNVLFVVGRIDIPASEGVAVSKMIRQRIPDGFGRWLYNLEGVRRVLYNLPEVRRAHTVFVVEGEKAADALRSRLKAVNLWGGMVATTSSGGADNAHRTPFQKALTGKTVVLLPDNDEPGRRYAGYIASECLYTSIVKRIELPNLPDKGDVVDYFEAGGTLKDLLQLVEAAPQLEKADFGNEEPNARTGDASTGATSASNASAPITGTRTGFDDATSQSGAYATNNGPRNEPHDEIQIHSLADLLARRQPSWLINGVLAQRSTSLLTAQHGNFKSFLALDMALCIATGREWHGHKVEKGAVLYIAAEGSDGLLQRALAWLEHHNISEYPDTFSCLPNSLALADFQKIKQLVARLKTIRPILIVVDTLARCTPGLDENSSRDMGAFIQGVEDLSDATGAHVMVVHHNNKSGAYRGSSAVPGAVDTCMSMVRKGNEVTLSTEKQRNAPLGEPHIFETKNVLFQHPKFHSEKLSSIVLVRIDAIPNVVGPHLTLLERKTLQALIDGAGQLGATAAEWKNFCKEDDVSTHKMPRTRGKLVDYGAVTVKDKNGVFVKNLVDVPRSQLASLVYTPNLKSLWLQDSSRHSSQRDSAKSTREEDGDFNGDASGFDFDGDPSEDAFDFGEGEDE